MIRPTLLLLFPLTSTAVAQDWGPWHVIGPFDHPRGHTDVAASTSVERGLDRLDVDDPGPRLDREHVGKGRAELRWRALAGSAGTLDVGPIRFADVLPAPPGVEAWSDRAVAYLYRTVECARPVELAVRMGSDDGMRFWLNGELLIDRAVPRGLNVSDHSLVLPLEEGTNHVLVKVANGGGGWGYQVEGWSKIPQASIDQAIDRGVQMLLRHQLLDGSWAGHDAYGSGLTAYAGYCLLKMGLPRDHPAVRRARAFVLANPTPYTYSRSCELLFLCTLHEPELLEVIEERLDELLDWQEGSGLWAYPVHPGGGVPPHDLSNTLYVALALRACEASGVDVPDRTWTRLLDGTLRCFEGVDGRAAPRGGDPGAGFSYRPHGNPTGSMTTAGVSVIEMCTQGLGGELPGRVRSEALRTRRAGLVWLADRTSWGENPGQGSHHHYFFVYGMERVGSILGLERVGDVNWYWDGASWLVRAQLRSGGWGGDENFVDTILALLFLRRASAPSTGPASDPRPDLWTTEDPAAPVRLAASGRRRTALWVVAFHEDVLERLEFPGERGPRVAEVRYLARRAGEDEFEEIGVVPGDGERPAADERFALQHRFPRAGEWEVKAELDVRVPPDAEDAPPGRDRLVAPVLGVRVEDVLAPEQLEYPTHRGENLLLGRDVAASASSQAGAQDPGKAADGRQATHWRCDPADAHPWLRLAVTRSVRGDRLLLSHAQPRASRADAPRAARVEVILDGRDRFELDLDPDPMRKSELRLERPERAQEIELRVLEIHGGELGRCSVGFAEVEFLRAR